MGLNFLKVRNGVTLNPQASAPASPTNGDIYYDSTLQSFVFYSGGNWVSLTSSASVAGAADLTSVQLTPAVVQNSLVRITGTTATNIDGLAASTNGKQVIIYNATNTTVTIKNQSLTETTPANRIITPTGADVALATGQSAVLTYDGVQSRWVVSSATGGNTGITVTTSTQTANYTIVTTDEAIFCDASSGTAFAVALPDATSNTGRVLYIKKIDFTGTNVSLTPLGGDLIDGLASYVFDTPMQAVIMIAIAGNWYLV